MGHSQQQHTTLSLGDISGSGLRSLRRHVGGIPAQRLLRTGDGGGGGGSKSSECPDLRHYLRYPHRLRMVGDYDRADQVDPGQDPYHRTARNRHSLDHRRGGTRAQSLRPGRSGLVRRLGQQGSADRRSADDRADDASTRLRILHRCIKLLWCQSELAPVVDTLPDIRYLRGRLRDRREKAMEVPRTIHTRHIRTDANIMGPK